MDHLSRAAALLHRLQIPAFAVLVDVETGSVYWLSLHGNPAVQGAFRAAVAAGQKTLTIRVPQAHRLPDTEPALLAAVGDALGWLMLDQARQFPPARTLRLAAERIDLDDLTRSFDAHRSALRAMQIQRLIDAGRLDDAYRQAETILLSESEGVPARFAAGQDLLRIFAARAFRSRRAALMEKVVPHRVHLTNQLVRLIRRPGAPRALQRHAFFLARSARLRATVEQDYGLYMSVQVQRAGGYALTEHLTQLARRRKSSPRLHQLCDGRLRTRSGSRSHHRARPGRACRDVHREARHPQGRGVAQAHVEGGSDRCGRDCCDMHAPLPGVPVAMVRERWGVRRRQGHPALLYRGLPRPGQGASGHVPAHDHRRLRWPAAPACGGSGGVA